MTTTKYPIPSSWLEDGYALHVAFPDSFALPDPQQIRELRIGDLVKLIFTADPARIRERMWVGVTRVCGGCSFEGVLTNQPLHQPVMVGVRVEFSASHIIGVRRGTAEALEQWLLWLRENQDPDEDDEDDLDDDWSRIAENARYLLDLGEDQLPADMTFADPGAKDLYERLRDRAAGDPS